MITREQLRAQGLWAYETGRLRAASRVALVLVPATAVCLFESRARGACACLAVALLSLAIWLRWRNRVGFESVTTGLLAGSVPLVAGLMLDRFDLQCGLGGSPMFCSGCAVLLGGASGVFIGLRESKRRRQLWSAVAACAVATLAASLGCVRLGVVGLASVVAGIALGLVGAAAATRRR
jgi:hypothetical protein